MFYPGLFILIESVDYSCCNEPLRILERLRDHFASKSTENTFPRFLPISLTWPCLQIGQQITLPNQILLQSLQKSSKKSEMHSIGNLKKLFETAPIFLCNKSPHNFATKMISNSLKLLSLIVLFPGDAYFSTNSRLIHGFI